MQIRHFFSEMKADNAKRHPVTNLVLWTIQVVSSVLIVLLIPNIFWSIGLLIDPYWSFIDIYGKGFIPFWIFCICISAGNWDIIRWRKKGLYIILLSCLISFFPLIWSEYQEFVAFTTISMTGIMLYFLSLLFKKNNISTWQQCEGYYKRANYAIIAVMFALVVAVPPILGYKAGFNKNFYWNGLNCLNARLQSSYYYKNAHARELAFCPALWHNGYSYFADSWFETALNVAKNNPDHRERRYQMVEVYANHICFLIKLHDIDKAKELYIESFQYVRGEEIREKIGCDHLLEKYLDEFDTLRESYM